MKVNKEILRLNPVKKIEFAFIQQIITAIKIRTHRKEMERKPLSDLIFLFKSNNAESNKRKVHAIMLSDITKTNHIKKTDVSIAAL